MKLPAVALIVTAALVQQNAVVQQRSPNGVIQGVVVSSDAADTSLIGEVISWAPPAPVDPAIRIHFQPSKAPVPTGYLVDTGAVFGDRGIGYRYGWAKENATAHNRNAP